LIPPRIMGLEQAIEFIKEDELIEVTPKSIRMRKKILEASKRYLDRKIIKETVAYT
jgi:GTP-binding protein